MGGAGKRSSCSALDCLCCCCRSADDGVSVTDRTFFFLRCTCVCFLAPQDSITWHCRYVPALYTGTRRDTPIIWSRAATHFCVVCIKSSTLAFFFFFQSSGGWGKIKLKLTTLPRIFIRVVCRFNSVALAVPVLLLSPTSLTSVALFNRHYWESPTTAWYSYLVRTTENVIGLFFTWFQNTSFSPPVGAGSSKKRTRIVCCCLLLLMMIFSLFVSLFLAFLSPPFEGMRCGRNVAVQKTW